MSIPIIGKCFSKVEQFLDYLEAIQFGAWRPQYVVVHHTGAPDLKTHAGYMRRKHPITDEQWLQNLRGYYESLGWSRAPHFFFTPNNYCVLSLPTVRGTHAVSFNPNSWGVEMVGDFDKGRDAFSGELADRYAAGLAALHLAAGLSVDPFVLKRSGLHFHRDDPLTSKSCPGSGIEKESLVGAIKHKMALMSQGDHPDEKVVAALPMTARRHGVVAAPATDPKLNVRGGASGKSPILGVLRNGDRVEIVGEAMNGATKWLHLDIVGNDDGWVAAQFVKLDGAA